jgi:hypothetical protein
MIQSVTVTDKFIIFIDRMCLSIHLHPTAIHQLSRIMQGQRALQSQNLNFKNRHVETDKIVILNIRCDDIY